LKDNGTLREDLKQQDYFLLPQKAWKKIVAWYGGGPTIFRRVIVTGVVNQSLHVELFPLRLRVMKIETEEVRNFDFSRNSTVKEIRRVIAANWKLALMKCKLFLVDESEVTKDEFQHKTLIELQFVPNQVVLMKSTDVPFALSGKIMGLTNLKEEPSLIDRVLSTAHHPIKTEEEKRPVAKVTVEKAEVLPGGSISLRRNTIGGASLNGRPKDEKVKEIPRFRTMTISEKRRSGRFGSLKELASAIELRNLKLGKRPSKENLWQLKESDMDKEIIVKEMDKEHEKDSPKPDSSGSILERDHSDEEPEVELQNRKTKRISDTEANMNVANAS